MNLNWPGPVTIHENGLLSAHTIPHAEVSAYAADIGNVIVMFIEHTPLPESDVLLSIKVPGQPIMTFITDETITRSIWAN